MEKIKQFIDKFFKRKDKKNKVLYKLPKKKRFSQKRGGLNIKINFTKYLKFFKKNYIPYYLILGFFILLILVFIILGPIFRIEKINIIKKDGITNIDIAYKSVEDLRGESSFKIEKSEVFNRMRDYQENLKSINLDISFPKTINIVAESFKEKFNVKINKKNYFLLENGSLIPTINTSKELKNLEIIKDIDKVKILDYKVIFDMDYIKKIEEIERKVRENISSIEITALKYYEKERELHIILNNVTRLIFSLDNEISVDEQIKSLAVLDRENSQIANNDKIYIDLRVKGKVFFCSIVDDKNQTKERQCNENLRNIYGDI